MRTTTRPRRVSGNGNGGAAAEAPPIRRPRRPAALDAWDVLRIVRSRRATVAIATLSFVALSALAAFVQKPVYSASSLVLIEPRKPKIASGEGVFDPNQNTGTLLLDYYRTEYEILKSRTILEPVAKALGVAEREEFRSSPDPVADFAETVKAEPVRDSRLVRVSVSSTDAPFATEATDAIVTRFIEENAGRLSSINDAGLTKLRALARELRPLYEKAMADVEAFKLDNRIFLPGPLTPDSQTPEFQQLKDLSQQLTAARTQRSRLQSEFGAIVASVDSSVPTVPNVSPAIRSVFEEILVERARLASELDDLRGFFKEGHPQLQTASARLAAVDLRLAEETDRTVRRLKMEATAAEALETQLEAAVVAAGRAAGITAERASRLKVLADEAATLSESYKAVTKRLGELEIQSATDAKDQNIFILDRARASPLPIRPKKPLFLAAGLVLGLLAGLSLCLLAELLDDRVKSREDLLRIAGEPILGFVPRVAPGSWREPAIPELEAMYSPRSSFAESLRSIRTGLGFVMPPDSPRVVLVTSADPGDGKTTVAVNLAITLAQAGQRVLLVDANLRRSRLHEFFDVSGSATGLSAMLARGEAGALDAVCSTKYPYLDVLPAGPVPPNPAELLGSDVTKAFLESALGTYSWVVIDAPSVAVADPAVLLTYVPYYVLVVRLFATAKSSLARAQDVLARTPARSVGLVVNTVDVPRNLEASEQYGPGSARRARPRPVHAASRVLLLGALLSGALSASLVARAWSQGHALPVVELAPETRLPRVTLAPDEDATSWGVAACLGIASLVLAGFGVTLRRRETAATGALRSSRPFTAPPPPAWLSSGGAWGLTVPAGGRMAAPAPSATVAATAPTALLPGDDNAPTVTELHPSACAIDRSITQVTIGGRKLDQVVAVSLHETPCVLHASPDSTKLLVSVPAYLIQEGQWHFELKTPRGVFASAAPFTILPPPSPVVALVRPTEVAHNASDPPALEVSGRHFARLQAVKLVGTSGSGVCTIVQQPDPEPNDQHVIAKLPADARPGSYRVVVETRSGSSAEGPTVTVQPDLADTIEDLRRRVFRKIKLEGLEPTAKEKLEALLWDGKDMDEGTRASLKAGQLGASIAPEDLPGLHDDLARVLRNDRARAPLEALREKCPEWIAGAAELALARFVADMEPRVRAPSEADVEGYMRAAASALRWLRLGEAFVFDAARARRLKRSLQTVLALYREKELLHVLGKIKDHLAAVVGVTLPEPSDDAGLA